MHLFWQSKQLHLLVHFLPFKKQEQYFFLQLLRLQEQQVTSLVLLYA